MLTALDEWHAALNVQASHDEDARARQFGLRAVTTQTGTAPVGNLPGEVWAWQQPDRRPPATPMSGTVRVGFAGRRFHLGHIGLARSVAQAVPSHGRVLLFGGSAAASGAVNVFEHVVTSFGAPDAPVVVVPDDDALHRTQQEALDVLHVGKLLRVYGWDEHTSANVFTDLSAMLGFFLHDPSDGDRRDVAFVDAKQAAHSVALERASRTMGTPAPTLLYRRLFPSLRQPTGRGSVKDPASTIFLDDAPETVRAKFRSAVTGGREHVEEQREHGGDPTRCPVFATIELLRPADEAHETLAACQTGRLLCGECKARNADSIAASVSELGTPPLRASQSSHVAPAVAETVRTLHLIPPRRPIALETALANQHRLDPSQVVVAHGTTEIMDLTLRTQTTGGSTVVATAPTFELYADLAARHGFNYTAVPWNARLKHDAAALVDTVDEDTAVCVLDLPHSVSGAMSPFDVVQQVAAALPAHALLLLDLVYTDYVRTEVPSARELLRVHPNTVVCRSFSKTHCLLGARVGYGLANRSMADRLRAQRLPYAMSSLTLAAAEAALLDDDATQRTVAASHQARARLTAVLSRLGLRFAPTEGNFQLFDLGPHHTVVTDGLRERGFRFRDGERWGLPGWVQVHLIDLPTLRPVLDALNGVAGRAAVGSPPAPSATETEHA